MKIIKEFIVEKKLVVQVILVIFTMLGLYIINGMNREAFPNVALDKVVIEAPLPGGTPEEIERLIAIPLEKQLRSVNNIDKVRSYNLENICMIMVFLVDGAKNNKVIVDDIKAAVALTRLPQNAIKPSVREITTEKQQVIDIALTLANPGTSANDSYRTLRNIAKSYEDRLYQLKDVAEVQKFGYRNRQFLVEVKPDALNAKEIGLNTLLNKLGTRNIDVPSGILKLKGKEYLLRTKGQFERASDMRNIPLQGNLLGFQTTLKDVANIYDTFEEEKIYEKINGKHAIILRIWKTQQADIITTAEKVKTMTNSIKSDYPETNVIIFDDKSIDVTRQLNNLGLNFATGLTLVVVFLFAILGFRLSSMISLAIPLIFIIAFIIVNQFGITINTVSIFALVMVLGMMVDNSIVVAENTFRLMQEGLERKEAIFMTFKNVVTPILVSMLVISAAFIPLLFMSGMIGKFIFGIPAVILITLFVSMVFSLTFLPNWLNTFLPKKVPITHKHDEAEVQTGIFGFIGKIYKFSLTYALKYRPIALVTFSLFFVAMLGFAGKFLSFVMFPPGGEEVVELKTWMPIGTTLEKNLNTINILEPVLLSLSGKDLEYMRSRIGIHETKVIDPKPGQETHRAHITLKLLPVSERHEKWQEATELVKLIRKSVDQLKKHGKIENGLFVDVSAQIKGPPIGKPVSLEIRGADYKIIQEITDLYIGELRKIKGVYDIRLDLEKGKAEYRFHVKDGLAARTGISARDIARSVRTAYNGEVASSISKGEDKINIMVRYPESSRKTIHSLNNVKVENRDRRLVPLKKVTYITKERNYSMINRQDLQRVVRLEASVNTRITTSLEVNRTIQKTIKLDKKYKDYSVNFGGEQEDASKSMRDFAVAMGFAVAVIFAIFIIYFNSIGNTLVIIGSIPFGIIGVLFALLTHGQPLSFMSMLAIVALSGSIVANALILITFIEQLRADGIPLEKAIISGGVIRLRPIFLTTLTTVIGLLPSAYGIPTLDRFVQPLSLAFAWGLMFATVVTLVFVPILYRLKEDIVYKSQQLFQKGANHE